MSQVGMRWSPEQYSMFGDERVTPFVDLVAAVRATAPRRVVDLGCGPGPLTVSLAQRWPGAEVVGIDSSSEMIASATALPDLPPSVEFRTGAIEDWVPSAADDVVVTNAALQWVPTHRALLVEWFRALPAGAWFAMQVPGMSSSPSHTVLREIADRPRWRDRLADAVRPEDAVGTPADYLGLMLDAGMTARAWETTYCQVLPGEDAVLEWVRGSRLRPMLAALDADEAAELETEVRAGLREVYPRTPHGTPYPFRRVFAVGRTPG